MYHIFFILTFLLVAKCLLCIASLLLNKLIIQIFYLFVFRERGREGESEGEKHQHVVTSHMPSTRNLAHNPGMCPDWELNRQTFGSQAGA